MGSIKEQQKTRPKVESGDEEVMKRYNVGKLQELRMYETKWQRRKMLLHIILAGQITNYLDISFQNR